LPGVTASLQFPSAIIRPPRTPQRVAVGPRQLQRARPSDRAPNDSRRAVDSPVQSRHRVEPQAQAQGQGQSQGQNNVYDDEQEEENNNGDEHNNGEEWEEWSGFGSDGEGQALPSSQGSCSQGSRAQSNELADLPQAVALNDEEDEAIPDIPSDAIGAFPTVQELQVAIN